jgi:hypothetical protein
VNASQSSSLDVSAGPVPRLDHGTAPAPPTRGRQISWRRRLITWPAALLLIVATVVAGRLILVNTPIGDDYNRPFIHSGRMGEAVDGRTFVATVLSVRGGRSLAQIFDPVTTDGIFLLVKVRLSAYDEEVAVSYQALVDRNGFIYEPPVRDFNVMQGHRLQPRIPVAGELLFEVPESAAAGGLTLRLSTYGFGTNSHQVVVEIPLTITATDVATWSRNTEPIRPMPPEVTT